MEEEKDEQIAKTVSQHVTVPTEDLEKENSEEPIDACSSLIKLFPDSLYEVTSTSTTTIFIYIILSLPNNYLTYIIERRRFWKTSKAQFRLAPKRYNTMEALPK